MPRFTKLFALGFVLMGLMFAPSAFAESASPKQLQVNVILFLGKGSNTTLTYQTPGLKGPGFYGTNSRAYGSLRIKRKMVYLMLHPGERVVYSEVSYSKGTTQVTRTWSGKTPLPQYVILNNRPIPLDFVSMEIHSPRLQNQQPVPSGPPVPPAPVPQLSCQPDNQTPTNNGGAPLISGVSLSTPDGLQQWTTWLNAELQLSANGQPADQLKPFIVQMDDGSQLSCTVS